jgi:group II intron reverse transcriptase/maturase
MTQFFIDLLAWGTIFSSLLVIISANPVIAVIFLIAVFCNAAGFLILLGVGFIGISYIILYVGAITVLFLFVIMMFNVRRCAWLVREIINLNPYSNRVLTTELGRKENWRLNTASLLKGIISSNRKERVEFRVNLSMVKAILPEVYTIEVPHHGLYHIRVKIYTVLPLTCWSRGKGVTVTQTSITCINLWKGLPKESVIETKPRTTGSPKGSNSYGDRVPIVPRYKNIWERGTEYSATNKFKLGFGETRRCLSYTTSCLLPLQSRSKGLNTQAIVGQESGMLRTDLTILKKLADLNTRSQKYPQGVIDRNLYSMMLDQSIYLMAYDKLKSKPGNMTPGINPTTLDGISKKWIVETIESLRTEQFKFTPGRRIQIPKANGGQRPLTIANPRDKIVQECIRMILESIFEPTFSDNSHGFRTGRSCHSALKHVKSKFDSSTWIIEGDISKCFDKINHNLLMKLIETKILDRKFTNLIWKALNAGYFEFRTFQHSLTGTPQGSIISPILANIFLDQLDKFVEQLAANYSKGERARPNPAYTRLRYLRNQAENPEIARNLFKQMQTLPYIDPFDPNFRRLVYVRYADDWMVGIRGPQADAQNVMNLISNFLETELKLNLNKEKTLITHWQKDKVLFLGTLIGKARTRTFSKISRGQPIRNALKLRFEAPIDRITKKLTSASFIKNGRSSPKFLWMANSKDQIITLYNSVLRGYLNYYSFVHNYAKMAGWVYMNLKFSCAKLLAAKYTLVSQSKVYKKFGKNLKGSDRIGFMKITYKVKPWDFKTSSKDYIMTLFTDKLSTATFDKLVCSLCGSNYRVEMHHIRQLKDINPKLSKIDALMAARRRKQIAVCRNCHLKIHSSKK